uniref:Nucleoside diphosphate kinase n=1 Tax=candidate division WOR-3 bacterium TaxID=2052148 RepID=A0A7C2P5K3_UNCW3
MHLNRTFLLLKPDAFQKRVVGEIISIVEKAGFDILDIRMKRWTREEAEKFYAVHRGKEFFEGLVEFMISGPVIGLLLQKENAIEDLRKLVGATDPSRAEPGTIRHKYGTNVRVNAVHASDSPESFDYEVKCFFGDE